MIWIVAIHTCLLSAKCWNSLMTVFAIFLGYQYLTSHPDRTIVVQILVITDTKQAPS